MIDDFLKYLSLKSANKTELESETLPYTFYTPPRNLKNYRIYGNTEEISGESVSVGEKTENLFRSESDSESDYYHLDASLASVNYGFAGAKGGNRRIFFIKVEPNTKYIISFLTETDRLAIVGYNDTFDVMSYYNVTTSTPQNRKYPDELLCNFSRNADEGIYVPLIYAFETSANTKYIGVYYAYEIIPTGVQFVLGGNYKIPVIVNEHTTNIFLESPLADGDYIDYKSQKRYNAGDTAKDVVLPKIVIYDGENEISFDTTVKPSKVYLQGNISTTEVPLRSLQASPQMLNLQLGKFAFLPNDFSENLDDLDELEQGNIVDKTPIKSLEIKAIGDDENAER